MVTTCTLLSDQTVNCWGNDGNGELGDGTSGGVFTRPGAVTGVSGATALWVGGSHACAKLSGGSLKCWGRDNSGQLGNNAALAGTATPAFVSGYSSAGVSLLPAGLGNTSCVLDPQGLVRCWGDNTTGQIGDNGSTAQGAGQNLPTPSSSVYGLSSGDNISYIGTGTQHICAIKGNSKVYCWGDNSNAELGNNSAVPTVLPVQAEMTGN